MILRQVLVAIILLLVGSASIGYAAAELDPVPGGCFAVANNDFAVKLYRSLAEADENLFFSPFSVSAALAMAAEGARGETAEEMGRVLAYPQEMRTVGADSVSVPWRMAMLHSNLAALIQQLGEKGNPASGAVRDEIARLRQELAIAQARVQEVAQGDDMEAMYRAGDAENAVLDVLNPLLATVDCYELQVANSLWGERTYPFRKTYLDTIDRYYGTGGVISCDFRNDYPAERMRINQWVEENTAEKILDLLPELPIDEAMRLKLVLVNAVYFMGEWAEPFQASMTAPGPFMLASGGTAPTTLMKAYDFEQARYAAFNADGTFFATPKMAAPGEEAACYPDVDGFMMVSLPYKGGNLAMVVIAPRSSTGLLGIEHMLVPGVLETWLARLEARMVEIVLPRFKLEGDYDLSQTLRAMGMGRAFGDPGMGAAPADYSGMFESADPNDQLYISKVLHKSFVEVTEEGTEAAAATAVMMPMITSAMPQLEPFTPEFRADRPFLFLIRDRASGCILFMGRMVRPVGD